MKHFFNIESLTMEGTRQ